MCLEIKITFPGGKRADAETNGVVIPADQPLEDDGEGTAPSAFSYFLASLGTCAGIYVLSFCKQRGIATKGMLLTQQMEFGVDAAGNKGLSRLTKKFCSLPVSQSDTVCYHSIYRGDWIVDAEAMGKMVWGLDGRNIYPL